jgi:hypothetical protein
VEVLKRIPITVYYLEKRLASKLDTMSKKVFNTNEEGLHAKAVLRNDLRVTQGGKLT